MPLSGVGVLAREEVMINITDCKWPKMNLLWRAFLTVSLCVWLCHSSGSANECALLRDTPDSVYLFAYATAENYNHNGLQFAWSPDREKWFTIGQGYGFLKSDYGRWGTEKRMITPCLVQSADGIWHCAWSLNERDKVFAYASSGDLIHWGRQSYPKISSGANFMQPMWQLNRRTQTYSLTYRDSTGGYFRLQTKDFRSFENISGEEGDDKNTRETIRLPEGEVTGQVFLVPWSTVNQLIKAWNLNQYKRTLYSETSGLDSVRFKNLQPVTLSVSLLPEKQKAISDRLMGVFFEDINYAADGGLYAELVQNRDFEYLPGDKEFRDKSWNSMHSWALKGLQTSFSIDSVLPLHPHNPHYAVLITSRPGAALVNTGFDGIAVKKGAQYHFSVFAMKFKSDI